MFIWIENCGIYRVFIKYCVFSLKCCEIFLNSVSSAAALVFYLPGVFTIFNEHPGVKDGIAKGSQRAKGWIVLTSFYYPFAIPLRSHHAYIFCCPFSVFDSGCFLPLGPGIPGSPGTPGGPGTARTWCSSATLTSSCIGATGGTEGRAPPFDKLLISTLLIRGRSKMWSYY